MLPFFDDLEKIGGIEIAGADEAVALSFSSPQGAGVVDSVHLFVQVGDQLFSIDVQGLESLEDAQATAVGLAELQIGCAINGDCATAGGIT
jgi:hypothetical protein